jgi:phosphoribosyl 1,2-cyclic phosphate phosphodiesterase
VHLSLEEAVLFASRVGAKQTWLMHISHLVDHEEGNRLLPVGVSLAYDGLELEFSLNNKDLVV